MIIKPPNPLPQPNDQGIVPRSVFLAGSIEMGAAENWQTKFEKYLDDRRVTVFNPRRDDWDSSWKQEITDPQFSTQVNWELNALRMAEVIVMYLDPATKSPISLLELGLHAKSGKIIVGCPDGFYRKGNVHIVCERHNIPFFSGPNVKFIQESLLSAIPHLFK